MARWIKLAVIACSVALHTEAVNECTVHDNCRYCRDGAIVVRDPQSPSRLVYGGGHCMLNSADVCVDIYTHLPCSGDASTCPADKLSNVVAEYLQPAWYQNCGDQKRKYVMGPAGCQGGADKFGSCLPEYWPETTTTTTVTTTQNTTTTSNSTTTTLEAFSEPAISFSTAYQYELVPITEGMAAWIDYIDYFTNIPSDLLGKTLVRSIHHWMTGDTITWDIQGLTTVYAIHEWGNGHFRDGNWRNELPKQGWTLIHEGVMYWNSMPCNIYSKTMTTGTLQFPVIGYDSASGQMADVYTIPGHPNPNQARYLVGGFAFASAS